MSEPLPYPHLVQRLVRRSSPNDRHVGVDRDFTLEYMGSAEFEFGTANRQLRALVEVYERLEILPALVNGHTLWYLGLPQQLAEAEALIADQAHATPRYRFQERPHLRERLIPEGDARMLARLYTATGWWAYTEHASGFMEAPWLLFLEQNDAEAFKAGVDRYRAHINSPPAPKEEP